MAKRDRLVAVAASAVVALLTLAPYLFAGRLAGPGDAFSGFLINPVDGFSYLAKMRQGADGAWLFHLPFTSNPGPGAFIFTYYLLLGHIAAALGLRLIVVYHAARCLAALAMGVLAYAFFERTLPDRGARWAAWILAMLGSGFGWAFLASGLVGSDLQIPESVPFMTAYANAHFPLAAAALLGCTLAVALSPAPPAFRALAGLLCGAVLGVVLPFVVVTAVAVLGVWLAWEVVLGLRLGRLPFAGGEGLKGALGAYIGLGLGAAPWVAYDVWLTRTHPALAGWTVQNQTPSPPPAEYLIGYAPLLILALVGIWMRWPQRLPAGRLLLVWSLVNGALLYAPFGLQRRLALGLSFPLAGLAALGLQGLARQPGALARLLAAVLALSLPSNLIAVAAGLAGVQAHQPGLTLSRGEVEAEVWLRKGVPPGALVLSGPVVGNHLPAYANVRVLYGHPFETPQAEQALRLVERLYSSTGTLAEVQAAGVDYIYLGADERALGPAEWLQTLPAVFQAEGVAIYKARAP